MLVRTSSAQHKLTAAIQQCVCLVHYPPWQFYEARFVQHFIVNLWNRADHYIFVLWFHSVFFPSPNLSRWRLDVYHTFTHGVALVRI